MKISEISQDQLRVLIRALIELYSHHVNPIPAELSLRYNFVLETKNSYKVIFTYVVGGEEVLVDSETNSYETRGETLETDYFTILLTEDVIKLERYINDVLDGVIL
jgi:hypothetical protein